MNNDADITLLLREWVAGSDLAMERLIPLVYEQLRRSAGRAIAAEHPGHTLQATALVNEVFLKLVDAEVDWQSRAHFYALTARMMRRLLVNYAKERNAEKRGGKLNRIEFAEERLVDQGRPGQQVDLLALHSALEELAELDERKVELIELQYFAGLTFREMEEVTGLSSSTLDRELRFSRSWLKSRLTRAEPG